VLAGPRTARLTQALVYDKQMAASISAFQLTNEDVGEFAISISPRPTAQLTDIETEIDALVERLKAEGPTAQEIQAALASQELQFLNGLQSNLGKSMTLADAAGYNGDPGHFTADYQKQLAVTPADVKRVANTYLGEGRIVLSVVPEGKPQLASKPDESKRVK
jgi:zinc protease